MSRVSSSVNVTNVRYTHIIHAGGGIAIGTLISGNGNGGAPAKEGTRFSIHDIVMDDVNRKYLGDGELFHMANGSPSNPINTIAIDHITGFPDANGSLLVLGNNAANPQMYGFVMTNSVATTGKYPVWSDGRGKSNCAHTDVPLTSMNACFATYTFNNNLIVASPSQYPPSSWPSLSLFASSPDDVGFVDYENGNGGNYQLQPGSPYKNLGTDGRDLGADVAGLIQALAGVN